MFPHSITIYNKYMSGKIEKWKRTVIHGVLWDSIKGASVRKSGVASIDGLRLIIPMDIDGYVVPDEWQQDGWTLQTGDVVVKGEIETEAINSISEIKQYDSRTITSIDIKDFGLPHWEVSAK